MSWGGIGKAQMTMLLMGSFIRLRNSSNVAQTHLPLNPMATLTNKTAESKNDSALHLLMTILNVTGDCPSSLVSS